MVHKPDEHRDDDRSLYRDLASELLQRDAGGLGYEDRQFIERDDFASIAERVGKRMRVNVWVGIPTVLMFFAMGTMRLVDRGSSDETFGSTSISQSSFDLWAGIGFLATAIILGSFYGYAYARDRNLCEELWKLARRAEF